MVHPLKVTLEQIYKGSARTLRLTRKADHMAVWCGARDASFGLGRRQRVRVGRESGPSRKRAPAPVPPRRSAPDLRGWPQARVR